MDELLQLIREAEVLAGAEQVDKALDTYAKALALSIFLETALATRGEGTSSAVALPKSELKQTQLSEQLTLGRSLLAHDAVKLAISSKRVGRALEYLSMIKGRKLMMRMAASRLGRFSSVLDKVDFVTVATEEPRTHVDEAGSTSIVALIEFYCSQDQGDVYAAVSLADRGTSELSIHRLLNPDQTAILRQALRRFLKSRERQQWRGYLRKILELLKLSFGPIVDMLEVKGVKKVILVPHRFLHLLPWHGCCSSTSDEVLFDRVPIVTYVSNSILYDLCARAREPDKSQQPSAAGCFDVDGIPSGWAGAVIFSQLFTHLQGTVLVKPSRDLFLRLAEGKTFLTFEGHGCADFEDYERSRLIMSDGYTSFKDVLSVGEYSHYMIILNACETGVNVNFDDIQDEYYGLDGAFLSTGSRSVVSTLWPVDDIAALLMSYRMMSGLVNGEGHPSQLVGIAARWLRQGNWHNEKDRLLEMCDPSKLEGEVPVELKREAEHALIKFRARLNRLDRRAFAGAEHWSAWRCSGFGGNAD